MRAGEIFFTLALQTRNKKTKHIVNWSGFRLRAWSPPGHTSLGLMSHIIIIFFFFTSLYIECSSRPTAALASTSNSPNLARITANLSFTDTFGARTSHVRPVGKPIRKKKKKVSRPPNHSVCTPELNPTSSKTAITYLHNLMICQSVQFAFLVIQGRSTRTLGPRVVNSSFEHLR